MKRPSPFLSSSSDSDNDEENYNGSDFQGNTNFPGFGDFGNFDSDSFSQQPPPHLRRLVAEGEDGGCADHAGGCNDHEGSGSGSGSGYGGGGDNDNGHNHNRNRAYEDRLVDFFLRMVKHANNPNPNPNKNNGNDDDSHRHPRVGSYLDISDGSGTYSYGRAYLHLLLDALTNHPDTVHVVDGSYFENMDLQYRSDPKYLFRFASNGKVFARLYVDLPPHTLPPQSSIVDPRPTQDPRSSCTICPTCHRTRSFDDDARAEVEENKQSKGLQADQEMKQCSSEQKTQKSSTDKKQDDVNEQDEKRNTNEQQNENPNDIRNK